MEEVKYIQGDLVKLDGRLKVIIRPEIDDFRVRDIETHLITLCTIGSVEPINLTPQILEANGWEKGELMQGDNGRASYYAYSKKGCIVELRYYPSCDMFLPYIGQVALMNTLFLYVHQLQNLLFGLNLPMSLKV